MIVINILYITLSKGWGGLERNLLVMARWLQDAGHRVEVAAPIDSKCWEQALRWGLVLSPTPAVLAGRTARQAKTWAKDKQADVVWIRDGRDLDFAGVVSRALGAALVMQQAMQIPRRKKAPWHYVRYRRVDAWVSGLNYLKTQCVSRTPITDECCHVLPLPLDDHWFDPRKMETTFRKDLGLSEEIWLMGTVGRLDPKKGQRTALQALATLPTHVHWVFVGTNTIDNDQDECQTLMQLAKDLEIEHRAHFVAAQEDLVPIYDALDGFAMTSHSETIGTVTLEAMARKVPIIGTNAGGTSELLAMGRGQLILPQNAHALADAVKRMMTESRSSLDAQVQKGREYASACRPSRLIPAWEELLTTVLQSKRKT